jgi:hypothetical protein
MKNAEIKKKKIHLLKLTKYELLHLRDLFSVSLPPDAKKTVSQVLAESENRAFVETNLWNKVSDACKNAELPMGDDAPDYIIAPTSTPSLGIFQIDSEPNAEQEKSIFEEDEITEDENDE